MLELQQWAEAEVVARSALDVASKLHEVHTSLRTHPPSRSDVADFLDAARWQAYPKGFYRLALALDGQGKTEEAKLVLRDGTPVRYCVCSCAPRAVAPRIGAAMESVGTCAAALRKTPDPGDALASLLTSYAKRLVEWDTPWMTEDEQRQVHHCRTETTREPHRYCLSSLGVARHSPVGLGRSLSAPFRSCGAPRCCGPSLRRWPYWRRFEKLKSGLPWGRVHEPIHFAIQHGSLRDARHCLQVRTVRTDGSQQCVTLWPCWLSAEEPTVLRCRRALKLHRGWCMLPCRVAALVQLDPKCVNLRNAPTQECPLHVAAALAPAHEDGLKICELLLACGA